MIYLDLSSRCAVTFGDIEAQATESPIDVFCEQRGWPTAVARAWQARRWRDWTEAQSAAWRAGIDRMERDWIVAAPTSSGKTAVAEVAAVGRLMQGERVVWLAPTRALAEQTAATLRESLGGAGWSVALSTGVHDADEQAVAMGDYDLLVTVYEKALAWLARGEGEFLAGVGLVVADELGILRDAERGGRADLLLTLIGCDRHPVRRLGLCGPTAGDDERRALRDWWGGGLLEAEGRPRPLREGILEPVTGRWRWREEPTGETGEEEVIDGDGWREALESIEHAAPGHRTSDRTSRDNWRGVATLAAAWGLARRGEPTLLFAPTRAVARRWSATLGRVATADRAIAPDERAAFAAPLDELMCAERPEPSHDTRQLVELLKSGVAFHHADLCPRARRLAERAFESGIARLLVATPTLGQGVNLCACNVIQWPWSIRGAERGGMGRLEVWRWREQGGRAARLGRGDGAGRTLLIAGGEEELDGLWSRYVERRAHEPIRPSFGAREAGMTILHALGGKARRTASNLAGLAAATFAAECGGEPARQRLADEMHEAARRALDLGLVARDEATDTFSITPTGRACARHGIEIETATRLMRMLRSSILSTHDHPILSRAAMGRAVIVLSRCTPPGYWPKSHAASAAVADWLGAVGLDEKAIEAVLHSPDDDAGDRAGNRAALAAAVRVLHWLEADDIESAEHASGWSAGMLRRAAEGLGWMARAAAAIAGESDRSAAPPEMWRQVADHLAGDDSIACASIRSASTAHEEKVADWACAWHLELDLTSPGVVRAGGRELALSPRGFDLLAALAERPGRVATRDWLYQKIWPDGGPEDQQLDDHRRRLARQLAEATGESPARVIEVIRGSGFRLNLPEDRVQLIRN